MRRIRRDPRLFICGAHLGVAVWIMLFGLAAPLPVRAQGIGQNTIRGKVTGPDGRAVEVEVKLLEVTRTVIASTLSDSNGGFTFQAVADGVYFVTVDSDAYQHLEVSTHVEWPTNPINEALLSLTRRIPSKPSAPNGYRSGAKVVSIQALKARFPKQAVKVYEKGNAEAARGNREAAILSYQKALALAPKMYPALNNLGNAYLQGKEMVKAEAAFREAVTLEPNEGEPYINLGHLHFENKQYEEAQKFLSRGLSLSPDSSMGLFFLGSTYSRLGNWEQAESNLQKALAGNDPSIAVAHLELANVYLKTHRRTRALREFDAFLKESPEGPLAGQVRQALARLKQSDPIP
jgi:tetratricopeptide (TPR) repeat protein